MNEKELTVIEKFSEIGRDEEALVKELVNCAKHAMYREHGTSGLVEKFSVDGDYSERVNKAKIALLKYCGDKTGISKIDSPKDVIRAFDNDSFSKLYNSVVVSALESIMLKNNPAQLLALANIVDVEFGGSYTWNIEPKGLPVAQRASYGSNVTFLDGYAKSGITIKPQAYSMATSMDYIRILDGSYDIGMEIARVAMGMLYAQLELITSLIYSTTPLTGTPLYQATFSANGYIQLAEDIKMLNGGSDVTAYGTKMAFNKIGTIATTNYGFATQDEMIREGYLGMAYGIKHVVLSQITDLRDPFTTATADDLRLLSNDLILLLSSVADKPVKLVRENFVRVKVKEANEGSEFKYNYSYYMAFDAAIVTQAHYGIQNTANA